MLKGGTQFVWKRKFHVFSSRNEKYARAESTCFITK